MVFAPSRSGRCSYTACTLRRPLAAGRAQHGALARPCPPPGCVETTCVEKDGPSSNPNIASTQLSLIILPCCCREGALPRGPQGAASVVVQCSRSSSTPTCGAWPPSPSTAASATTPPSRPSVREDAVARGAVNVARCSATKPAAASAVCVWPRASSDSDTATRPSLAPAPGHVAAVPSSC